MRSRLVRIILRLFWDIYQAEKARYVYDPSKSDT